MKYTKIPNLRLHKVPRAKLVLFRGHKNPHLRRALESLAGECYDPNLREIFVDLRFLYNFLRFLAVTGSSQRAAALAYLRVAEARVVCMMENYDKRLQTNAEERWSDVIGRHLPNVQIVKVQHAQYIQRQPISENRRGILAVWGQFCADWFPQFGRVERTYVVVGALQDSRYRSLIRNVKLRERPGICVVSTVKDTVWWGPPRTERRLGYDALMEYIARYAEETQLPVAVALTVDRTTTNGENQVELERRYFTDRFGPKVFFPDPNKRFGGLIEDSEFDIVEQSNKERFSSYVLTDISTLTVGAASSTLWEAFGRGNRVLSVNLTDNPALDFPIPGRWAMRQPTYEDFAERCTELIAMPIEQYQSLSAEARKYLMFYEESDPPEERLRRFIGDLITSGDPETSSSGFDGGKFQ